MSRILLLACVLFFCVGSPAASAHELLPKALVEYVQEHPDATPEQIQAFVESDPALKEADTGRQQKLVELARTQGEGGFWSNVWNFLILGVEHILSGPDHVLFVFSLLLTFVTFRKTAWLLTCFTLAHSITIILAGSHILRVSSSIVEPLIALSIAYVAITSVFLARRYPLFADTRAKALTLLGFGFFHGMGFAGALDDIAVPKSLFLFLTSLLSFNLGVDIGQLSIVIIALPILLLLRRSKWYVPGTRVAACIISVLALGWFVQRIVSPA